MVKKCTFYRRSKKRRPIRSFSALSGLRHGPRFRVRCPWLTTTPVTSGQPSPTRSNTNHQNTDPAWPHWIPTYEYPHGRSSAWTGAQRQVPLTGRSSSEPRFTRAPQKLLNITDCTKLSQNILSKNEKTRFFENFTVECSLASDINLRVTVLIFFGNLWQWFFCTETRLAKTSS